MINKFTGILASVLPESEYEALQQAFAETPA